MESVEPPVYEGFLLLATTGIIVKKSWQKKYCLLYKRSSSGIKRLEIYETDTKTSQVKIITLEDVIKITPKPPNAFSILTKSAEYEFATVTENTFNSWLRAVQTVAFPDENPPFTSIEEENDLYCSTDTSVFYVKLHPSEASERCLLANKDYTLRLTSTELELYDDCKLLYAWPYCYIRKYGYKNGKFTFEAGRKCASGEGSFFLEHPQQGEIYRCLTSKMKYMKNLLHSNSLPSLLSCSDAQLQIASNKEARSRSPLPPFHTATRRSSHRSFEESEFYSSPDSLTSMLKAMPKKPPRKSITPKSFPKPLIPVTNFKNEYESDYDPVDNIRDSKYLDENSDGYHTLPFDVSEYGQGKYDTVEDRTEAWRTQGVDNPSHNELTPEETYVSWGENSITKSISKMKLTENSRAPTVIAEPSVSSDGQNYNVLQHFSSSKLNLNSDYVMPPPSQSCIAFSTINVYNGTPSNAPEGNLYDEVGVMEPARLADDSHLGYGRIRKDNASGALKEVEAKEVPSKDSPFLNGGGGLQKVHHQLHNNKAYAIVSKPKHV